MPNVRVAAMMLTLAVALPTALADARHRPDPVQVAMPAETPDTPTLDFGVDEGRMTVPVTVDGSGPFRFVIDTGAERSVISRELAARLSLRPGRPTRVLDFIGSSTVDTVLIPALAISALGARRVEAPALLTSDLGASGLLGIDALQGHKVSIDFPRKRMQVRPSKRRLTGEVVVRAENRQGQLIFTEASFNGHRIAVIIDTGSLITVGNSAMRALARRVPKRYASISVTAVTGRAFHADLVAVDNLKIGNVRLDNVGMAFSDVAPFAQFGLRDTPALILGMSSLRLFRRVELDFANREVAFALPRPPIDFRSACRSFSNCVAR